MGQYGVQLFFVISPITIFMTLEADHERFSGSHHVTLRFYIKRFFRIAPLLRGHRDLWTDQLGRTAFGLRARVGAWRAQSRRRCAERAVPACAIALGHQQRRTGRMVHRRRNVVLSPCAADLFLNADPRAACIDIRRGDGGVGDGDVAGRLQRDAGLQRREQHVSLFLAPGPATLFHRRDVGMVCFSALSHGCVEHHV